MCSNKKLFGAYWREIEETSSIYDCQRVYEEQKQEGLILNEGQEKIGKEKVC